MIGRPPTIDEVRGKRVAIWYNAEPPWGFPNTRVLYRSVYPELPGAGMVLRTVLVQVAIFALGVFLIRRAMKRLRRAASNGGSRRRSRARRFRSHD